MVSTALVVRAAPRGDDRDLVQGELGACSSIRPSHTRIAHHAVTS